MSEVKTAEEIRFSFFSRAVPDNRYRRETLALCAAVPCASSAASPLYTEPLCQSRRGYRAGGPGHVARA